MTPFGERLRALRAEQGMRQETLAARLQVSPAYLSALEHGHRGKPNLRLLHQICQVFGLIWDEADALKELAALSDPKTKINTERLSASHTLLANRLARRLPELSEAQAKNWLALLDQEADTRTGQAA